MSSGGSKTKDQTVTQSSAPWGPQQEPLKTGIEDALALYKSGGLKQDYFPGSTLANKSPETLAAWQGTADRAINGSPVNAASSDYLTRVLNGDYLNPGNPHEAALTQSISNRIAPQVASQFSAGGRYGSPSQGSQFTTEFTDALAPLLFQNYQGERSNQQQAASLAPTIANQDYVDLAALKGVGDERTQYGQDQINEAIKKWNFEQQAPAQNIQALMSLVGGNYGGTSTTTQPVQVQSTNPWLTALGGGLGLASAFL